MIGAVAGGLLKRACTTDRTKLAGRSWVADRSWVAGRSCVADRSWVTGTWRSRSLIAFVAILLVVMPWTEYFCDFDRFLRGGQDCEFGLLALASFLCMVIVVSHCCRRRIAVLLAMLRWLALVYPADEWSMKAHEGGGVLALADVLPVWGAAYGRYNLPLQI